MTRLELVAASRAQEAGYLALADIAQLAERTGIDYRIVGGQMVSLHVAASGADDLALRQTLRVLDNSTIDLVTVVPEITAALCVKTLGYADRLAAKDALDVWRLLTAYRLRIPSPRPWPDSGVQGDAAKILRRDFGQASGAGARAASNVRADQAQIRALVLHALGH